MIESADGQVEVLLVDDHADLRKLMRLGLQRSGRFRVVGEAGNGTEAIELATELQPDIVILDLLMPELDGREALPTILLRSPRSMVVVLSALDAKTEAAPAIATGAFAYLEKTEVADDLADVIAGLYADFRRALTGETVIAPAAMGRSLTA